MTWQPDYATATTGDYKNITTGASGCWWSGAGACNWPRLCGNTFAVTGGRVCVCWRVPSIDG